MSIYQNRFQNSDRSKVMLIARRILEKLGYGGMIQSLAMNKINELSDKVLSEILAEVRKEIQ